MGQVEELVIIGAGPAGLAAAAAARSLDPLVLECGTFAQDRNQNDPASVLQGVGGAGLFSDGKFSFWPSASALWQLNSKFLYPAYAWFTKLLESVGISVPNLPRKLPAQLPAHVIGEKRYLSLDSSFHDREYLIDRLAGRIAKLTTQASVSRLSDSTGDWKVFLKSGAAISTRRVILATGRLGPLLAREWLPTQTMRALRFEAGVRIEQPAAEFFLAGHPQLDPKYVWRNREGTVEWRTFCCCRQGKIVEADFDALTTACGRADCPPTGRSNVGFNVRLLDPAEAVATQRHLLSAARQLTHPVRQRLDDFLDDVREERDGPLAKLLGRALSARLAKGLQLLMQQFAGHDLANATLVGPTVEGVGLYPIHDQLLATPARELWVAGDVAGTFRGLTAALISGHVAGQAVAEARRSQA